ncbi:MAG: CBS domain-containing protein [Gammaproteobacteria bacterium]|nr:CBS domain-containing protein [Gammaproteobacteria bacterium]MCP4873884.1 CBS domain-containing protein [Gammaproteobacteria bacterium]MCP4979525.1 CBS domain-containing protein [Gammaproteobacteria bacterium]
MNKSIENYMATELVCFAPDDDIIDAMRTLLERHISGAPVLDSDGQMLGLLTQKDCLAIVYNTAYHQDWGGQVEQYMSREVEHIDADSSILEVAEKFLHSNFRRFPVLRDGRLAGLISRHDIMRALDENYLATSA